MSTRPRNLSSFLKRNKSTCVCRSNDERKFWLIKISFYNLNLFDIKRDARRSRIQIDRIWTRARQQKTSACERALLGTVMSDDKPTRIYGHLGGPRCAARDFPEGWHASVDMFSFRRWSPFRKKKLYPLPRHNLLERVHMAGVAQFNCQSRSDRQITPTEYICVSSKRPRYDLDLVHQLQEKSLKFVPLNIQYS